MSACYLRKTSRSLHAVLVVCGNEEASGATAGAIIDARRLDVVTGFKSWENELGFSKLVASNTLERFLT